MDWYHPGCDVCCLHRSSDNGKQEAAYTGHNCQSCTRFALAIPFFLPEMHERYFYLADVISIIYAFYFPRYFFVAIIMQLCSLLSYVSYFLQTPIVNLACVAIAMLVITVITTVDLILTLYPNIRKNAAIQASS
jgi:Gpi18-like mannosyltransferase